MTSIELIRKRDLDFDDLLLDGVFDQFTAVMKVQLLHEV